MNFNTQQLVQSFYIHWPFCPYRCHFCPFVALAGQDQHMQDYHAALKQEIKTFLTEPVLHPLKTVFFGGGTPSTYPLEMLEQTISLLRDQCGFEQSYEMTIELNPGTVTPEKLEGWKRLGINRLSVGVQSLNDAVLTKLNRHQKAADVYRLMHQAEPIFDNISVDIIVGLPGVSTNEWKSMIETMVTWPIKHISMYFLTVHEDTQLYFGVQQKSIQLPCDDEVVDTYYWTIEKLAQHGIMQYEISNFARPGWESQHNTVYWQRKPYKAFGLGACSFDGYSRFQNEKNLLKYIKGIHHNDTISLFTEKLSDKQVWLECLMLGLRQLKGVSLLEMLEPLSDEEKKEFICQVNELVSSQLLTCLDGRIALTLTGLSVANEIVVKLSCIEKRIQRTEQMSAQDSIKTVEA